MLFLDLMNNYPTFSDVERWLDDNTQQRINLDAPNIEILEAFCKTREDLLNNLGIAIIDKTKVGILEKWLGDTVFLRLIFDNKFKLEICYDGNPFEHKTTYRDVIIYIANQILTILQSITIWYFEQCSRCHKYYLAGMDEDLRCSECILKSENHHDKLQGEGSYPELITKYSKKKIQKEFGKPMSN